MDVKRRLERKEVKGNQCINTGTLHIRVPKRSEHFVRKNKRPRPKSRFTHMLHKHENFDETSF